MRTPPNVLERSRLRFDHAAPHGVQVIDIATHSSLPAGQRVPRRTTTATLCLHGTPVALFRRVQREAPDRAVAMFDTTIGPGAASQLREALIAWAAPLLIPSDPARLLDASTGAPCHHRIAALLVDHVVEARSLMIDIDDTARPALTAIAESAGWLHLDRPRDPDDSSDDFEDPDYPVWTRYSAEDITTRVRPALASYLAQ